MNREVRTALLSLVFLPMVLRAEIRLTAISDLGGKGPQFVLVDTDTKAQASWIGLGATFENYTLSAFDQKTQTLVLKSESEVLKLQLARPVIVDPAPAAPAVSYQSMSDDELAQHGLSRTRAGDTMSRIAKQAGISVAQLMALNPGVEPRSLRVGQILRTRVEAK
jgi:hypothetical protein